MSMSKNSPRRRQSSGLASAFREESNSGDDSAVVVYGERQTSGAVGDYNDDEGDISWSGKVQKRGHFVKSWKTRHICIRNGLFLYWRSDVEATHCPTSPTGTALVTDCSEWEQADSLGWIISTVGIDGEKKFFIRGFSPEDKEGAMRALQCAANCVKTTLEELSVEKKLDLHSSIGVIMGRGAIFDDAIKSLGSG